MEIINCEKGYHESINFVDEKDSFVGYDLDQDCCENAGWYISTSPKFNEETESIHESLNLADYIFNDSYVIDTTNCEDGSYASFMLWNNKNYKKPHQIYLFIFNVHNGYYAHGFTARVQHAKIEGCL